MTKLLLALSFLCLSLPSSVNKLAFKKNPVPVAIDLFEKPEDIKLSWLGDLQSDNTDRHITNLPMFIYRDGQSTYAKIICVPKSLPKWNEKFKGKNAKEKASINKTLALGIINHSFGEKTFSIYAFLQQDNKKGILVDKNNNVTTFPATIFIYRNNGTKWTQLAQKIVASSKAYQKLQYSIALASATM